MQAANLKQAARHTQEVEELLLELSKQHAAAQVALPHTPQGISGGALPQSSQGASGTALPQGQNADEPSRSPTPLPPRLTTPASPSRRPSTHPMGFHTPPPEGPHASPQEAGAKANSVLTEQAQHKSLRAERGRSFSSRWGKAFFLCSLFLTNPLVAKLKSLLEDCYCNSQICPSNAQASERAFLAKARPTPCEGALHVNCCKYQSFMPAGSQQAPALDIMGMAGGAEEGDQVVFGGVPTRPSSASTTGRSNTWEVKGCMSVCLCVVCNLDGDLHS